jgi:purine-cytosine permease-like protein
MLEILMSNYSATVSRARDGIERYGVEFVPERDRTSRPLNLFTNLFGSNLTFAIIILGFVPASLGLPWWGSFTSIVVGTVIGGVLLAPVALLGPRTGTNGPVSTGPFFGVIGRIVGSLISIFNSIGFLALAVWTGGQVAVYGAHDLFGLSDGKTALGISYALVSIICVYTTVVGHDHLVRLNRWLIPTAGLLIIIGFFVYAGRFHTHQLWPGYALGSYSATWTLAVTIAAATTFGYCVFVNDWTRYVSRERYSSASVASSVALGGSLGVGVPMVFGAFTTYAIGTVDKGYVSGLLGITPTAFMIPVILIGLGGSLGQAALCLYGAGLDLASIVRPINRPLATVYLSIISIAFVYMGGLIWEIESTVEAFVSVMGVLAGAWLGVVLVGMLRQRGDYDIRDLQVFNEGRTGGKYWYFKGFNVAGVGAWVVASVVGILFSATSIYTGPWSAVANGVDLSWLTAGVLGAVLYLVLQAVIPRMSSTGAAVAADDVAMLEASEFGA